MTQRRLWPLLPEPCVWTSPCKFSALGRSAKEIDEEQNANGGKGRIMRSRGSDLL